MDRVVRGIGREQVDAEQHAVRMVRAQLPRRARLSAQLRDPRSDVHVEVRIRGEHPVHPREIFGEASDVRADEPRARMRSDDGLERVDQPLEPGEPRIGERPLRMGEQLLEPFVACVDRLEERHRVRDVDHDRQPERTCHIPHVGETLVVGEQPLAVLVVDREPEILPDLDATRAGIGRHPQLPLDPVRPAGLGASGEIEVAERREPARMGAVVPVDVRLQLVAPPAVQVHDRVDVGRIHVGEQRPDVAGRPSAVGGQPAAEVVMRVHHGEPRPRNEVLRQPERRPRPVRAQREVAQGRVERRGLQSGRSHGVIRW